MSRLLPPHHVFYVSSAPQPVLEILDDTGVAGLIPFQRAEAGRSPGEWIWRASLAEVRLPEGPWRFCIDLGEAGVDQPPFDAAYTTTLRSWWLQDGQLFDYRPASQVSPPQVLRIEHFVGSLPTRALYIYLPRGYAEHTERRYPVVYMHDGQNCFETFVDDSYAGSWRAEEAATLVIDQGLMRECIIVGVGHGVQERIFEYLPPYAYQRPLPRRPTEAAPPSLVAPPLRRPLQLEPGRADRTYLYYREDVAPTINRRYRTLTGREHTATCGSSMGGLFSIYLAWEHPEFARHHAALSTSFWCTRTPQGKLEAVERLRALPKRDIRLWLDSGTRSAPDRGDDGYRDTLAARRALLQAGYVDGVDFLHYVDEGAIHSESSWAARLPLILQFLFPTTNQDYQDWQS